MPLDEIKALTFDVFGTVVDWRGTIVSEGSRMNRERGWDVDWAAFADAWRALYQPSMSEVRDGERSWVRLDDLHRDFVDHDVAQRLEDLRDESSNFKPYSVNSDAPMITDELAEDLRKTKVTIERHKRNLQKFLADEQQIVSRFAGDISRFKILKGIE